MFTKAFLKAAAERAVKTFAQTLAGFIVVVGAGVGDIDWSRSLSVAAVATVASLLSSVVSSGIGDNGPSLTHAEQLDPTA